MTDGAAELLEFLEKGGDLKTLLAQQTPPALSDMLDRAAIARAFDEDVYDEVLRRGASDPPSLAALTAHPDVQPLGGESGWFRGRDAAAARRAGAWRQRVSTIEWIELERALAAAFERRGDGWQHFRLHHLVAADPRAATMPSTARSRGDPLDLARCEDLLHIVKQRDAFPKCIRPPDGRRASRRSTNPSPSPAAASTPASRRPTMVSIAATSSALPCNGTGAFPARGDQKP
ncbi:MAG: hypothetical protein U0575_05680 [Phycisphaerales bacterium]